MSNLRVTCLFCSKDHDVPPRNTLKWCSCGAAFRHHRVDANHEARGVAVMFKQMTGQNFNGHNDVHMARRGFICNNAHCMRPRQKGKQYGVTFLQVPANLLKKKHSKTS